MLVSVQELTTYMDISFSLRQQDAAEMVLMGLQSELDSYLGRPVELTTYVDEEYVTPAVNNPMPMSSFFYQQSLESSYYTSNGNAPNSAVNYALPPETIYLRNTPVLSVASVKLKKIGSDEVTLEVGNDYVVRRYGVDVYFSLADDLIKVTYTAGIDGTQIPAFRLLILRAATREMQNMHDDVVGVKDLNSRNVAPLETGFTERELLSIKKFKKNRVVG
jgi:hypothetical protein